MEDLTIPCCFEFLEQMAKKISSVLKPGDLVVVFDEIEAGFEIDFKSLDSKGSVRVFLFGQIKALEVFTVGCGFKMVYMSIGSAFDCSGW